MRFWVKITCLFIIVRQKPQLWFGLKPTQNPGLNEHRSGPPEKLILCLSLYQVKRLKILVDLHMPT